MEPEKKDGQAADMKATVSDLHNEGVDIMEGEHSALDDGSSATPAAKPEPAPVQAPIYRPNAPIAPVVTSSIPEPINDPSINDPSIKPLRTFKSDAEEAVRYQNVSKADIVLAEQKKRESTPIEYENDKRSHLGMALLLLLIVVIATGGYYWFFIRETVVINSIPKELHISTFIPYSKISLVTLPTLEKNPLALIAERLNEPGVTVGQVAALIPTPAGTTTVMSSVSAVLAGTHVPDRLGRSLAPEYMIGTYLFKKNAPFIIFKNTFFQNAFASMLEWEKDMRNDFISLIQVSNPSETTIDTRSDIFSDMVISNIDARVLKNDAGTVILTYAFADKDTIIITTDTDALKYILDRLLAVRVVQ